MYEALSCELLVYEALSCELLVYEALSYYVIEWVITVVSVPSLASQAVPI